MSAFYRFIKIIGYIFLKPFLPLKIFGRDNIKRGKGVLVCNHYRMIDIVMQGIVVKKEQVHFVGKKELFKNRFIHWFFKKAGAISIDREGSDLTAMKAIMKALKEDKKLSIFPEGTRNKTGRELLEIKPGAAVIAIKTKSPVYPMVFYKKQRFFKKNYLIVGESYEYTEFYDKKLTPEDVESATNIMRDKLLELQKELWERVDSKKKKRKKDEDNKS